MVSCRDRYTSVGTNMARQYDDVLYWEGNYESAGIYIANVIYVRILYTERMYMG